jgi:hypothetical protein
LRSRTAKAFETLELKYESFDEVRDFVKNKLTQTQKDRIESVFNLIKGFESTLSLEILSSIHFLRSQDKNLTKKDLLEKIQSWNDRNKNLIKEEYIEIALKHLEDYGSKMSFA